MGQKVHPYGFRLGTLYGWQSNWFAEQRYAEQLHEDIKIRAFVKKKLYHAGISRVVIERTGDKVVLNIHTARPGILIGKRGAEVETLRSGARPASPTNKEVFVNIKEIRKAELDAQLVAENVALQLERRVAFRRAMKKAVTSDDEVRRRRHPHPVLGPPRRLRDGAPRVVSRGARAAAHAARRDRLRPRRGQDHLRRDRREVLGVQGRRLGQGPAPGHARASASASCRRDRPMLQPKKVKHRKVQKGRMRGKAYRGGTLAFGDYGLQALEPVALTCAPDRGGARRDDPPRQARRQGLDPRSSRTSRSPRSPPRPAWARARAIPRSGWPS